MLEMKYQVFTMNNEYMTKVDELRANQNRKQQDEGGQAAPPSVTMTVETPSMKEVNPIQVKSSVIDFDSTSSLNPEVLTSKLLMAPVMVNNPSTLTYNETDSKKITKEHCIHSV
jgi:hypothetical protein